MGEYFHCAPNIPHYAGNKAKFVMKVGHCFTIEPMINTGTWKDVHWADGWTAVTKDGKPSAQFEHQLLMHESGADTRWRYIVGLAAFFRKIEKRVIRTVWAPTRWPSSTRVAWASPRAPSCLADAQTCRL